MTESMEGSGGLSGIRALVVDDDPAVLDVFCLILTLAGALVDSAPSADIALAFVIARDVDVVVSDLHMPGRDGSWLARQVRARARQTGRAIPIVAISGNPADAEAGEVAADGLFAGYIQKPVTPQELCRVVGAVLATRRRPAR